MKRKLSKLLIQHGMTQSELATKLGLTRQNLYNKMVANRLTPAQLQQIASILNVPVSYFTDDTSETIRHQELIMDADNSSNEIRLKEKIEYLERIIAEKEKNIQVMESLIEYLKNHKPE